MQIRWERAFLAEGTSSSVGGWGCARARSHVSSVVIPAEHLVLEDMAIPQIF